jgi:hypothetical protein
LMVRRLEDGSEDWVANGGDVSGGVNFQWVINKEFVDKAESARRIK